jgi:predicted short-subunit dehydrogenase-like oxidoreductase (DUF2520 family)
MTPMDLAAILDRLESFGPQRRLSGKRAQLAEVRERLTALNARGHSWRSIARELSAAGEKVTADLLRSVCRVKARQRGVKTTTRRSAPEGATNVHSASQPEPKIAPTAKHDGSFGARGLKL